MTKLIFFWIILVQFCISFFITVLGVIGWVHISSGILQTLVGVLIIEQAAAVIALFKSTDFFDSSRSLNSEGFDLLATLWTYQEKQFPNEPSKRWFMGINSSSADFTDFAEGFVRLKRLDLVDMQPGNVICLSNKGYQFCKKNSKKLLKRDRLFYLA